MCRGLGKSVLSGVLDPLVELVDAHSVRVEITLMEPSGEILLNLKRK